MEADASDPSRDVESGTSSATAMHGPEHRKSRCSCISIGNITWKCIKNFLIKNYLVIGLITAVCFALAIPWPGRAVDSVEVGSLKVFQTVLVIVIFVVSGLTLRTEEIKDAVKQWFAFIVGAISILFITPCMAFALVALPLQPPAYKYGLAIFALVPTTIASGITLVQSAMGNAALALMLTVVTNIVAVFILPYSITLVIPQSTGVNINAVQLLEKLVLTILVPLIVGKAIRELSSWVRKQAAAHKFALTMINNTSLILIVWMTVSSAQQNIVHTGFGTLCLIALAAILLHVIYLCVNFVLVKVLRLPQPEAAAVLVMGSEKTLPMAVTVIAYLPAVLGTAGQLTVPCVIAHISQVLMDAAITERMGSRVRAAAKKKEIADAEASEEAVEGGADVEKVSGTGASTPGAKEETAPASEATASDLGDGGDAGKPCTTEP